MGFQENLRYYRERAGYKQSKDFAQALDIPYSTYKGYETQGREPKYNTLCKIADLLNVSTDELLGRENNILGYNEDEQIKKEINEILSISDIKFLKLMNVNKKSIDFEIHGIDGNFIYRTIINKVFFVNTVHDIKEASKKTDKANIYQTILLEAIDTAILLITDKIRSLDNTKSKTEIEQSLIYDVPTLTKLQDLRTQIQENGILDIGEYKRPIQALVEAINRLTKSTNDLKKLQKISEKLNTHLNK